VAGNKRQCATGLQRHRFHHATAPVVAGVVVGFFRAIFGGGPNILLCERKKWSQEAQAYNGLIVSWGAVTAQASSAPRPTPGRQGSLELED
jgi:hypothetical protein